MTDSEPAAGVLYLVATPIGNLGDVSRRCLQILGQVDLLACEDSRMTARLLARHEIPRKTISYHAHNERRQAPRLVASLVEGRSVALVTDAGTPTVSDPGFLLVRAARAAGRPVVAIPGPSALLTALAVSGLPGQPFTFLGFLPPRRGPRRKRLSEVAPLPHTLVLFESPHRLARSLGDMADILGSRIAAVCREMTKRHEEVRVDRLERLAALFTSRDQVKGEITVVIAPPAKERPVRGLTEPPPPLPRAR
ncbi:MAG: 16S rRNA (cytidine(1402)-2'-O)-methyltransferase [Acidobacteriota bacterium]